MDLKVYFENNKGIGVLATADNAGAVDVALYGRPHVMSEHTVAFIMADRRSHANLQSNPQASYLFVETGSGYKGLRLYLTKIEESDDQQQIAQLRRGVHGGCPADDEPAEKKSFLVFFELTSVRPLVGD